jgi:hypothetical protein
MCLGSPGRVVSFESLVVTKTFLTVGEHRGTAAVVANRESTRSPERLSRTCEADLHGLP